MQNPLQFLNKSATDYIRYFLLLITVIIVVLIIPKKGKFKYEYEQGKPWMHEDLAAPFAFTLDKNPVEFSNEQNEIRESFKPYYNRDPKVENQQKDKFIQELTLAANEEGESNELKKFYISRGLAMLSDIYGKGIISLDTTHKSKPKEFIITEVRNSVAVDKQLANYYQLKEARSSVIERTNQDSMLNRGWFLTSLLSALTVNVTYDKRLSEKKLAELVGSVSSTKGLIKQDEKIITRGSIVTPDRFRMLESLRKEYETNIGKSYSIPLGYLILISLLFIMFGINLELFHKEIAASLRSLVLILLNVVIFIGVTSYITSQGVYNVYLIPYCMVPVILLSFFGIRIAILTHFLVIFLCGLVVANPYEFVLLQTFAGFTTVLSMARLRYISQFFVSAMIIFCAYGLVYLGISFIKTSTIRGVDWEGLEWFAGNFVLTLLAYPLIYVYEKIFGFLSDIRLLEFADINNKILKELFLRAPGTFQHSLQVSNLVEAVIDRIGGNALLARVGALYHDIGKIYNPEYFTENQRGTNPHEKLSEVESAEIIIAHVSQGVALAQKHHIPRKIIEFIRTHHGTTRVEYFYRHYLADHKDADETIFRYPGPKPSSKEMAVLMICDSVEAASRSLPSPDDKQIENLIDKIIDAKIQDNQFDLATITIQEINAVRRILKKHMKSIYHIRIQYPAEPAAK
jgi:putative nucleotidyltransferase with HDIG domain